MSNTGSDLPYRLPNEKFDYTKEQVAEVYRCKNDIVYFAEKYCRIITPKGRRNITLYDYQKSFLNDSIDHLRYILKCSRQVGKTTVTTVLITWYLVFGGGDKSIAVVSKDMKGAKEILKRVKIVYSELPKWLQMGVVDWNVTNIILQNGTQAECFPAGSEALRGFSINFLYLDEFAILKKNTANDFIDTVYPTIANDDDARIVITSCVTKDTLIYTDNGIQEIGEFADYNRPDGFGYNIKPYEVCGFKNERNKGVLFHNDGVKPTKIITTPFSQLESSLEHKYYAYKEGVGFGIYKTKELTTNDYISIKYGINNWGNNDDIDYHYHVNNRDKNVFNLEKLDTNFSYFLGMFLAEGCFTNKKGSYTVTITNNDDISNMLNSLNLKWNTYDGLHYTIHSKSLVKYLEYLGFDNNKKAKEKYIPKKLLQMSRDNIIALLQGIFDGDGTAHKNTCSVRINLSSKKMIKQIRALLLNLGILCNYSEGVTPPTELVKVSSNYYRLETSNEYAKLFFDVVGFRFIRKQKRMKNYKKSTRNRYDIIPFSKNTLRDIKEDNNINLPIFKGEHKNSKHFTRKRMLEIKNDYKFNIEKYEELMNNVQDNIIWTEISSIEDSVNEVYDFSLNDVENDKWCHSVLYEGIIGFQTPKGHNHFKDYWDLAKDEIAVGNDRKDFYKRMEVKWYDIPGRDERWKAKILRDLKGDDNRFSQEYETNFDLGGANSYFKVINLAESEYDSYYNDKTKAEHQNVLCRVWKYPEEIYGDTNIKQDRYYYIATVDVSEGLLEDSTVCHVFEFDKMTLKFDQICRFSTNVIDPKDIYEDLHFIYSELMNDRVDKIFIENNSFGRQVISTLMEHYPDEYSDKIYKGLIGTGNNQRRKLGVQTNKKTKPENIRELNYQLKKKNFWLRDGYTATEFGKFIKDGDKYYGDDFPDDEVMSAVVGMEFVKTDEYKEFVLNYKNNKFKVLDNKYVTDDEEEEKPQYILVNGKRKKLKTNMFDKYATYD